MAENQEEKKVVQPKAEYKFRAEVMVMINEKVKPEENKDLTEEQQKENVLKANIAEADVKDIFTKALEPEKLEDAGWIIEFAKFKKAPEGTKEAPLVNVREFLKTLIDIGGSKKYKRIYKKMKEIKKEDSEDEHANVSVEREMFDFFKNDLDGTLSDVTLTAPKTNAAHK